MTQSSNPAREFILACYDALLTAYGPQGWWPGESATEIVIGAILTQNTNWKNVEKAISNLRRAGLIDWKALHVVDQNHLAEMIRPAGYFNVKARRLKAFADWLANNYKSDLTRLSNESLQGLRTQLLSVNGIGPETADSILLYALNKPSFVVDAYTRRLAIRHGLCEMNVTYDELKSLFEMKLPTDTAMFNEYHALVVAVGKRHCGRQARCDGCPLRGFPHNELGL